MAGRTRLARINEGQDNSGDGSTLVRPPGCASGALAMHDDAAPSSATTSGRHLICTPRCPSRRAPAPRRRRSTPRSVSGSVGSGRPTSVYVTRTMADVHRSDAGSTFDVRHWRRRWMRNDVVAT